MKNENVNLQNTKPNNDDSPLLERAIDLAVRAHKGQVDKAGQPYILHPLRVMMKQATVEGKIVAVLHDVIEDGSPEAAEEVRALLPPALYEALLCVTKREDEHGAEGYRRFVERAANNPLARRVKIADLEDNLDVTRLPSISAKDDERINLYLATFRWLKGIETDFSE
jgi:(p)ppGpp synthase/HD superfamily hydrolase